jgi:hypothetical protein
MYRITEYSRQQAQKLNVDIKPSTKKHKKIDVYQQGKLVASIGDSRYLDFPNYVKLNGLAYAERKRSLYKMRHSKDRLKKNSPGFYADSILW